MRRAAVHSLQGHLVELLTSVEAAYRQVWDDIMADYGLEESEVKSYVFDGRVITQKDKTPR